MQRPASFLPSRRGAPSMGSRSGARAPWLPLPHSCPEGSTRPPPPAPPSASCAVTAHGCSGNTTGGSGNSTGGGAVKRSAGHLRPLPAPTSPGVRRVGGALLACFVMMQLYDCCRASILFFHGFYCPMNCEFSWLPHRDIFLLPIWSDYVFVVSSIGFPL